MKFIKYIAIFLVLFSLISQMSTAKTGRWIVVDELPTNDKALADCDLLKCADSMNCISFWDIFQPVDYYLIRRTTDGGNTWKDIYYDTTDYNVDIHRAPGIIALSYPSPKLIIGVGDYGLVVRSTDKGETWEKQKLNDSFQLVRIFMADEYYGFVQGSYYSNRRTPVQMLTEDGGKSWYRINPSNAMSEINFINRDLLYGLSGWTDSTGYHEKLIKVSNGWKDYDTLNRPVISNWLYAVDENNLWLSGGNQVLDSAGWQRWTQNIYHSGDGGKTWETQRDTVFGGDAIHESHFYDKNFGMACGFGGLMLITFDGGKHWIEEIVKDNIPNGLFFLMKSVQVMSPTTAFVIGSDDYVYKYTRNPVSVENQENKSKEFSISPNPASDYIEISIPSNNHTLKGVVECEIRICNVFGEGVRRVLHSGEDLGGVIRLDISTLSPGIYFVRVGTQMQKFIKI